MAGDDVDLAQDGVGVLAAVGQWRQQVGRRLLHDGYQPLPVGQEGGDGLVPAGEIGRGVARRPVVVGPARPAVIVRLDIVEDVALGQPHMLEQMPEAVVAARRACIDVLGREIGHGIFKVHVRLPLDQQVYQLFSQLVVAVHQWFLRWRMVRGIR